MERSRHPDYTEDQIRRALRRLWLGDELTRRRRLFNVIEDRTAVKIDLIIRKDRPLSPGSRCWSGTSQPPPENGRKPPS